MHKIAHAGESPTTTTTKSVPVPLALAQASPFSSLRAIEINKLATVAIIEQFPSGGTVCSEGERADRFFVIVRGSVRFYAKGSGFLREMGEGAIFGEVGVLAGIRAGNAKGGGRRTATAVAGAVGVCMLSLSSEVTASLLVPAAQEDGTTAIVRPRPRVAWAAAAAAAAAAPDAAGPTERDDADTDAPAGRESSAPAPSPTSPGLFHAGLGLAEAAASYRAEDRRREQQRSSANDAAPSSPPLEPLTPRHTAACTALRASFLGSNVRPETCMQFIDALRVRRCRKGEYVIRQGDAGDMFYVVQEGECVVTQNKLAATDGGEPAENKLVTLYEGSSFGERALVTEEPRVANVVAASPRGTTVLCLAKRDFRRLLRSDEGLARVLARRARTTDAIRERRAAVTKTKATPKAVTVNPAAIADRVRATSRIGRCDGQHVNRYRVLGALGRGSYGAVQLVEDTEDGSGGARYAMKVLSRRTLDARGRLGDVRREISIMKRLRHPNLVSLVEVIDDPSSDRLFLVQELAGKGSVLPV